MTARQTKAVAASVEIREGAGHHPQPTLHSLKPSAVSELSTGPVKAIVEDP